MSIIQINRMITSTKGIHESLFRSYHILEKTKGLLQEGTPGHVVLMLISEMEEEIDQSRWDNGPEQ